MPVSYSRCFGRLVRFIRPGFDTWCRPATAAGKKRKCSAAPVMLHRRSRERHGGSRRLIGFLKSGLMIYWRYPVTGFLNSRRAITASPPDSQQVRAGFGNLWFTAFAEDMSSICGVQVGWKILVYWSENTSLLVFLHWIYGFVRLCMGALLFLQLCMNTNSILGQIHAWKRTFSHQKTLLPFILSLKLKTTIQTISLLLYLTTTCSILDKAEDTQSLSLNFPPLLIFLCLWASLALYIHQIYVFGLPP